MEKIQSDMEMFMNSSNIRFNMTSTQVTYIMCDAAHICHLWQAVLCFIVIQFMTFFKLGLLWSPRSWVTVRRWHYF